MAPTLEEFAGDWTLRRRIRDRLSGRTGRFAGTASFAPAAEGLLCVEEGRLVWPGTAPLPGRRTCLWRADGDGIAVEFEDGRPFHRFVPAGIADAVHECSPDLYRVRYDFANWPRWGVRWSAHGPRKDYVMVSRYFRLRMGRR